MSNNCAPAFIAAIILCSVNASAVDFEPGIGVGMEYTDNATLAPDNEIHDLIAIAYVGAKLDAGSGPFKLIASTSLNYQSYTQDTFSDQHYFKLDATANWEMIKNQFNWKAQDYFSQQSIDNLNPDTPDNTQNTNIFTFGPDINLYISAIQSLTLQPVYRKFTYEIQDLDNQQNSLDASWNYQMFRTISVGISGGVNKVDYDEQTIVDNTFSNIHLNFTGKRPRVDYSIGLGATHVEREGGQNQRGKTGNIDWLLNITRYSNVRVYIASNLTDTNNVLLGAFINPENGDITNQQSSSAVYRNSLARFTYTRNDVSLKSTVWMESSRQNYEVEPQDREVQALGMAFNYPLTAALAIGMNADYSRIDLTDINRKDNEYRVGGNIDYRLSRKLRALLDVRYRDKNSDVNLEDFSEVSVFASLVYGYGALLR